MKGGRTAPRNNPAQGLRRSSWSASMKGGRTAPRNFDRPTGRLAGGLGFNEGGADCPPKQSKIARYALSAYALQ